MSYKDYDGVGKEWLKPILEMESKEQKTSQKVTQGSAKKAPRCDKTIDMFESFKQE